MFLFWVKLVFLQISFSLLFVKRILFYSVSPCSFHLFELARVLVRKKQIMLKTYRHFVRIPGFRIKVRHPRAEPTQASLVHDNHMCSTVHVLYMYSMYEYLRHLRQDHIVPVTSNRLYRAQFRKSEASTDTFHVWN